MMFGMSSARKERAEKHKNGEIKKEKYGHLRYGCPKHDKKTQFTGG